MANTQQVKLTANVVDGNGVKGSMRGYALVDPGSTVTEVKAMLTSFLNKIVPTTDSGLVGASLSIEDVDSPVGVTGSEPDSSIDEVGTLDFRVTASGRTFGFPILALKDALIVADKVVDGTGPILALATLLSAGETGITYTNQGYQALGAVFHSFRSDRRSKRDLRRLSGHNIS